MSSFFGFSPCVCRDFLISLHAKRTTNTSCIMRKILFIILVMAVAMLQAKENRWLVNGNHSVQWETSKGELPYNDHIEMSGLRASVVYYWGVDGGRRFSMDRHLVFPMLRTIPNKNQKYGCWNSIQPCTRNTVHYSNNNNPCSNILRFKLWNSHCCDICIPCGCLDLGIP